MPERVNFILNGVQTEVCVDPMRRLIDVLRDDLQLTGTKEGCGEGECGACVVLINGDLINSCITPVCKVAGKNIVTIEGYRETARFQVLKDCFEKQGSVQCGFCTPGMILAAEALLCTNPHPTEEDVRVGLSGNLCRCTGYNMIVEAVMLAAKEGEQLWATSTVR